MTTRPPWTGTTNADGYTYDGTEPDWCDEHDGQVHPAALIYVHDVPDAEVGRGICLNCAAVLNDAPRADDGDRDDEDQWWPDRAAWPEYGPEGPEGWRVMTEEATALLLLGEYVFLSGTGGMTYSPGDREPAALWVTCGDTFAYACADAEPMPQPEADPAGFWSLYDLVREHGGIGMVAWCARRRQQAPIAPKLDRLRAAGLATGFPGAGDDCDDDCDDDDIMDWAPGCGPAVRRDDDGETL